MKRKWILFPAAILTFFMSSCNLVLGNSNEETSPSQWNEKEENTKVPYVGDNGNWWIGNLDTGIQASGSDGKSISVLSTETIEMDGRTYTVVKFSDGTEIRIPNGLDGQNGMDGYTPYIKDGFWYINGVNTNLPAQGEDGTDGKDGETPFIGSNGNWWIGSQDTGVKAQGKDGEAPNIGENGNWWIRNQDTGIRAKGDNVEFRLNGTNIEWRSSSSPSWKVLFDISLLKGNDGTNGKSAYEIYKMYCGYEGTEEEWINDLVSGKLTFKNPGDIEYIPPIRIRVVQGEPLTLPERVVANYESGTVEEVNVTWNRDTITSDFIGEKKILGLVEGYAEKVECYVRVARYSSQDHYIDGYINGIMDGDKVTITAFNDTFLKTISPSDTGYYCFDRLNPGTYFLTIDANGYEAVEADTCTISELTKDPSSLFTNISHQNFSLKTLREEGYYFMWTDTENGPAAETISSIDNNPTVEFLSDEETEQISDIGAASALRDEFNLVLSDEKMAWNTQTSSRLYELYSLIPADVTQDLKSVWYLTTDHLQYDIEYNLVEDHYEVLLSADTLENATPRSAEINGIKGKYFSNRLYNAILRFVTDGGKDADKCERILKENFSCSFNVPNYEDLTSETTHENANSFQEFLPNEKLLILTMFEEMPEGMHQMKELKYLVRRQTGTSHPIYPTAAAVTWPTVHDPYIEFMDKTFTDTGGYYDTKRLIIHEKMHIFYEYYFSDALKEKWNEVGGWYLNPEDPDGWSTTKETEFVSAYAHQHNPDEDLAESFATYVIDPALLKSRSIEKFNFIKNYVASGTSYLISTREDLQFEVYNISPDYIYPGKIKSTIIHVTGGLYNDKVLTARYKLWGSKPEEGARSFWFRIVPKIENCYQMYDIQGAAVDSSGLVLEGSETISKYSAQTYWYTDQIRLTDDAGNERYVNGLDFGMKVFFDNPLADYEEPEFVQGSLELSLSKTNNPDHPDEQELKVEFDFKEDKGISRVLVRIVCLDQNKNSIDVDADLNEVDQSTGHAIVRLTIPDFLPSGTYAVTEISITDLAGNTMLEASTYGGLANEDNTIQIETPNPDTKGPSLDTNNIQVSATPSIPEAPNGETFVTINLRIKDDISGFKIGSIQLLDPLGNIHHFWVYPTPSWNTTYYQLGDPTEEKEFNFTLTLPKGSAPGIWGIYDISLTDFALNKSVYNFAEIIHFVVDD